MKKILQAINKNKAYIFPLVILVTLTVVMAFGLTYAYFDFVSDSEGGSSMRITATDLHVTLSNPTVNLSTLSPIYDDYKDTQANLFTFTLSNTSRKLAGCVDLYLYFTSISDGFQSPDIKWELVNSTLNSVTSGDFSQVADGRLLLKENQSIAIGTTYSYTLKIWYSFSTTVNQTPISGKINAKLTSIAYGGACASTRVTTYTSGTNEFTASVDGYYQIETYNSNGSYASGEIFLATGEKLYATVGTASDIKCYINSTTGLCGTSSGQNANNSRIMYAGNNFVNSFVSGMAGVNSPVYVNSSTDLSYNTLHPTGKFFLNGNVKFNTDNTTSRIVITYLGKYNERTNIKLNNVRYIKDCMNGSTANVNNHWVEIQAIKNGVNVAYKKTLSGDTTDQKIVNGIISASEYVSASSGNKCVTVDLGRTYDLDEIAVWHYYTDGRTYNNNITYVSSDNSSWLGVINKQEPETMYGKRVNAYSDGDSMPKYAQNGLILLYDAINNTGRSHSSTATTWTDLSGNGNDGIITNGTFNNDSLYLTGSSSGIVSSKTIDYGTSVSYEVVAELLTNAKMLIDSRASDGTGTQPFYFSSSNIQVYSSNGGSSNYTVTHSTDKKSYVVVIGPTGNSLYINGTKIGTNSTAKGITKTSNLYIGRRYSNTYNLQARIYSVRVYDRLLTDEEIASNYAIDKVRFGMN